MVLPGLANSLWCQHCFRQLRTRKETRGHTHTGTHERTNALAVSPCGRYHFVGHWPQGDGHILAGAGLNARANFGERWPQ